MLCKRHPPLMMTRDKLQLLLPLNFKFKWNNVWDPKKEARFLWQLWHEAVAVNLWRITISNLWLAWDNKVFNQVTWSQEKMKHRIW